MAGLNCWEFYRCPEDRLLACTAFTKNAGRTCWSVAGTLCGGRVQGIHAKKIGDCLKCDFYLQIKTKQL